ncbi:MAG: methyltransferase domain-containing protein [Clostridia bacterium]|nr:methyltransferase domain-containing protein [Clostridia bacterium]NCC75102.1 methyltransferase domain-containing protein [Clostridia bacterium]
MDELWIAADETLEDLQRAGLKLIQKTSGFRYGEDSVFLAAFAAGLVKQKKQVQAADLGAGSGAVSVLLAGRLPQVRLTAIEISPRPFSVLERNFALNQMQSQCTAVLGDVRDVTLLPRASLDLVVSNPPYRDPGRHLPPSRLQNDPQLALEWRTSVETTCLTMDDLMKSAACWLKPGGLIALVQRPANLPDILSAMRQYRIEPVALRTIVPLPGRAPTSLLVAGRLHGRPGSFRYLPDLIVNVSPGQPSPETRQIYGEETHDGSISF